MANKKSEVDRITTGRVWSRHKTQVLEDCLFINQIIAKVCKEMLFQKAVSLMALTNRNERAGAGNQPLFVLKTRR